MATEQHLADLREALDTLRLAMSENERLREVLSSIQFDLINCHQAAGRNACEHLKDAIRIVNTALAKGAMPE